jgi:N,N'-diacetyllegionaminate synthase
MSLLFLIPARGGSKGLPRKNLAAIAGIPLVGRAARVANAAGRSLQEAFRVVCSTDDSEIAGFAREWGAEVPFFRPKELATDEATSLSVVKHALGFLGSDFEAVVLLQPTSPLTAASDLCGAVDLFRQTGCPVVSVSAARHPTSWLLRMDLDGRLARSTKEPPVSRRQAGPKTVGANGAAFVASPSQWMEEGVWGPETRGFLMPPERSVDVDDAFDLEVARAIVESRPAGTVPLGSRTVGGPGEVYVIAEAGPNHNGSITRAKELAYVAREAGADAVKFQLYRAEEQITSRTPTAAYQKATTGKSSMLEMAKAYNLPWEAHREIVSHCRAVGITYLASCFDQAAVDFYVDELGGEAIKIGSGELTNAPLLRYTATRGRPVLLSTGMSNLPEVARAVDWILGTGDVPLALFHCVSSYPAPLESLNLNTLRSLRGAFGVATGFSDHSLGSVAAVTSVALGASILEKHFTIDKSLPGPDHAMSLEPVELKEYVAAVRAAAACLGTGEKCPQAEESDVRAVARRSLVALRRLEAGEVLTSANVGLRRPAGGIEPVDLERALGRSVRVAISEGTPIGWEELE